MKSQFRRIIGIVSVSFIVSVEIFSQADYFNIYANGNIRMLIIDPTGRKLGYDPVTKIYFEQIPQSSIGAAGIDIITDDGEPEPDESQLNPIEANIDDVIEGNYQIVVSGNSLAYFYLDITTRYNSTKVTHAGDGGIIDSGQTRIFSFTYTTTQGLVFEVEHVIFSSTLRQDLDNSFKLELIGEQNFYKELSSHLDNYEKHLAKKDSLKAAREVEKFQSRIRKEYLEADVKDKRFVARDGWEILNADAQYVIEHLVALPAKPIGTVLQQIDELKAELTRQQNKKSIGGVLLIKSLTFLADKAKGQLQKPQPSSNDSATAALSIAAFQLVLDEIWELTQALTGRNKKFAALYVYDEAYIQLHYRAKYILEALPAPRTLIDMKSVQMDDDVRKEFDAMQRMSKEQ